MALATFVFQATSNTGWWGKVQEQEFSF